MTLEVQKATPPTFGRGTRYIDTLLEVKIDENTPGSWAREDAVRIRKGWMFALYVVNSLVCVFGPLFKQHSLWYGAWLLVKSLFFSYVVGYVVLFFIVRYFGQRIGITEITPVGLLRYGVVFACLSVLMGALLVYVAPPGNFPV